MPAIGKPPYRRGSKKSTDMSVGILNGKPSIQVNWGGRIYGAPLSLIGAGNVKDSLDVSDIRATGNITFTRNSSVFNNSNRLLMVGGLVASGDNNMVIGSHSSLKSMVYHANNIDNIALGDNVLNLALNCKSNIAIGKDAMRYMGRHTDEVSADVSENVAIGNSALAGNSSVTHPQSKFNVAIGYNAMVDAHKADSASPNAAYNVCIGHSAGRYLSHQLNTYIGAAAGLGASSGSEGIKNTGIGYGALNAIEDGNCNVGVGHGSLSLVTDGDDNIGIGEGAGDTITDGSNNICIGDGTDVSASGAAGQVVISPTAVACTADNTTVIANTDIILDAAGDITLDAAGADVNILQADLNMPAGKRLYLDGGGDTFIAEFSADLVRHYVGGDIVMRLIEAGNDGNIVSFGTSCAGFIQDEPTFDADDTNCYFNRFGNKASLTFDGDNITDINLSFPDVSCNCVLLVRQDLTGSRTITNWKTFDQAGGNESTVKFAGGSNPTLTTTADKTDIISFYWDNDNHRAYGVASLNF